MARPRRQDIGNDNRREELVFAAARLFRDKGYHGTTMRDVGGAINMRPGSPFYHFATKQDLLFACVQEGLMSCLQALEAIDRRALCAPDYFRALARTHLRYLLESPRGVVPLVVDEWRHLEGERYEAALALRRRFERLWLLAFRRLREADLVRRADRRACWFFLGALHGICGWYDPKGRLSAEQLADDLVDWVLCAGGARTMHG
jgi:AcrR family transcriptional regulator